MIDVNSILRSDLLTGLVQPENFVGWVFSIDYTTAEVMVNDIWKARALGVPYGSFLVAATFDPSHFASTNADDRQVILLRVIGSAKLPQDGDMVRTRIDHLKDQPGRYPSDGVRELDPITQNELQFGGLSCRVLGTFYLRDDVMWLGSDIESFQTAARLNVYRPRGMALRSIVNHIDPSRRQSSEREVRQLGVDQPIPPFQIGTVRYTSTDRLHRQSEEEFVPVFVQPSDLLARRTAVLGMTRTGKSNMVKQLVSVVHRVASEGGVPIGQLIYDINGEYANANQQDRGSIADVFPEDTLRYRMLASDGFLDLRNNFYEQLEEGFITIKRELGEQTSTYIKTFLNLSLDEPDKKATGEHRRWEVKTAAYRVLLYRAGFTPPENTRIKFCASESVRSAVAAQASRVLPNPTSGMSLTDANEWFIALRKANIQSPLSSSTPGKPWVDDALSVLLNMIAQDQNGSFIAGFRVLADAVKYHSHRRSSEVSAEIYGHLSNGKIVILDLSVGDPAIREKISKQIAGHLFNQSMKAFVEGQTPPNLVLYIEEAHNLIGKELDLTDAWPRLAKEGAKFRIALVYSTQEASSVHPNILANTENWFVTHLNNDREIKEISRFYDFGDFGPSLLRAQDVGFARVKTLSGPFVVPVQIDKFDPEKLSAVPSSTNGRSLASGNS